MKFRSGVQLAIIWLGWCTSLSATEIVLDGPLSSHLEVLAPVNLDQDHEVGTLAGQTVIVTFFASWCPPCREEFRNLRTLRKVLTGAPLRIVAINVFEAWDENDAARMRRFLTDTRPNFPLLKGTSRTRRLFGGVDRIPTVFVFDSAGRQTMRFIHRRGATKMTATLDDLRAAVGLALGAD